jgi:hypothetical protein
MHLGGRVFGTPKARIPPGDKRLLDDYGGVIVYGFRAFASTLRHGHPFGA